jgi:autotransporter-associated beta strand protein
LGIAIALLAVSPLLADDQWGGEGFADHRTSLGDNWWDGSAPAAAAPGLLTFGATFNGSSGPVDVDVAYTNVTGISFAGAPGAYTINNSGGSFTFSTGASVTNNASGYNHTINAPLTSAGLTFNTVTNNLTIGGVISGTTITKTGSGTLTLSGTNTYTGTTTISGGTLRVSGGSAIADTGAVSLADVAGAVFELSSSETIGSLSGGGSTGGNVNLNANTLTVGDVTSTTYSGVISGTGALTKQGAGALTLAGTNTYSGSTTLNAGTIVLGNNSALGTGTLTLGGAGTLQSNDDTRLVSNAIATGGNALTVSGGNNLALSGAISGTGSLTKSGAGTLTLSGTNTYTGTTISAGTLKVSGGSAIADTGAVGLADVAGAVFELSNSETIGSLSGGGGSGGNVNLNANTLTVGDATSTTYSGVISGTGALMKQGSGALTLSGTNTHSGGTTLNAGTIILGNNAALGTGTLTLGGTGTLQSNDDARSVSNAIATGGNTLTVSGTDNLALTGDISGGGLLYKSGSNTLTLTGTNTYLGGTRLNGGTIVLGNNSALSSGNLLVSGNTAIQSNDDSRTLSNNALLLTNRILTVSGTNNLTLNGVIAGAGSLTKSGTGTLTLSGTNTYTGTTTISAGTLKVSSGSAIADTGAVSLADVAGAVFELSNSETIGSLSGGGSSGGTVNLNANTLTVGNATSTTYSGVISGTGALTKQGAGVLTLSGTNTHSGGTTLSAGTIILGNNAALGTGTLTLGGAGTLQSNDDARSVSNAIATAGNALAISGASNLALNGVISGTGSLTKTGAGTLTLGGANTYSGGTTVTTGILTGTSNSMQGNITNNAAVVFDQAGDGTYAGIMSGTGTLTKMGAGTIILSGNNTYTGLTTLSAGGLILSGQVGGALTVVGGTLSGDGTIGGTLTLNGGTFSPGGSIGTTIILGDYVQNAGSTLEVEVEKASSGTLRSDLLDVTSSATLEAGSTISVTDISASNCLIATGDTFTIIEADGGVTDNGAAITDSSAVLSFSGLVSGNNYQLVATRGAFATAVSRGNNSSVLKAIDSDLASATGDYITLINALTALNSVQLNDAAEKLNPLPHASVTKASLATTQRMAGNLVNYLRARRSGVEELMMLNTKSRENQLLIADASNDPRMLAYVINENKRIAKMQQDEADSKIKGFFQPFGVFYEHDSTPKMTGLYAKAVGTHFGLDKNYGSNLIIGIDGGYSHSFINFKESRGKGDVDSFQVGPYATYFKDDFFFDTSVSFGYHKNEIKRDIKFGTINRTAASDYHAYDLSTYIGGGYNFHINEWTMTPTTSIQYICYRRGDFEESGAGAAGLDLDAATSESLCGKLGVTLSTVTKLYGTQIVPELFAGWAHEFMDDEDIRAKFIQGTAKFTTGVDDEWDDSVYFGAGISALLKKNTSAFVRYEGECSSGNSMNSLNVGITILF